MKRIEPTHILVAFDAGKTTFRTEMYADYKAGRAKTPDEFREQFPLSVRCWMPWESSITNWIGMRQMTL